MQLLLGRKLYAYISQAILLVFMNWYWFLNKITAIFVNVSFLGNLKFDLLFFPFLSSIKMVIIGILFLKVCVILELSKSI